MHILIFFHNTHYISCILYIVHILHICPIIHILTLTQYLYTTHTPYTPLLILYTLIGPRADVIHAVWTAADVAARLIKAGGKNSAVTEAIKKVGQ